MKEKMNRRNNLVRFYLEPGNITNLGKLRKYQIDAIVNAARPTLMDGDKNSVDGRIHKAIDKLNGSKKGYFNEEIRLEIDGINTKPKETIRCQRGKAVITKGHGLCPYVIHAVGTKYPKKTKSKLCCPSSTVQGLESCYREIVEILKQHSDIRNIAIPLIGSGNYGFPKEYALEIALASLNNAILDWYQKDPEIFLMENSRKAGNLPYIKVYIYIYGISVKSKEWIELEKTFFKFEKYIRKGKIISYQSSVVTQFQYLADVLLNDWKRGYFTIAKVFRIILLFLRIIFSPIILIKDGIGKNDWKRRRYIVEILTTLKAVSGIIFCLWSNCISSNKLLQILMAVSIIFLLDTVTYLLTSVLLVDIQRPSSNIIRSLILLFVNYMETQLDLSFIMYSFYQIKNIELTFWDVLTFVFVDQTVLGKCGETIYVFSYTRGCLEFLFITFAFSYFLNYIHPKKFSS